MPQKNLVFPRDDVNLSHLQFYKSIKLCGASHSGGKWSSYLLAGSIKPLAVLREVAKSHQAVSEDACESLAYTCPEKHKRNFTHQMPLKSSFSTCSCEMNSTCSSPSLLMAMPEQSTWHYPASLVFSGEGMQWNQTLRI